MLTVKFGSWTRECEWEEDLDVIWLFSQQVDTVFIKQKLSHVTCILFFRFMWPIHQHYVDINKLWPPFDPTPKLCSYSSYFPQDFPVVIVSQVWTL